MKYVSIVIIAFQSAIMSQKKVQNWTSSQKLVSRNIGGENPPVPFKIGDNLKLIFKCLISGTRCLTVGVPGPLVYSARVRTIMYAR